MTIPKYEVSGQNVLKDGHTMFPEDVVGDIQALQRKVADSPPPFSDSLNSLVSFHCDGCGEITTNTTERYKLRLCDECEQSREAIELNYANHAMYGN